MPLLCLLLRRAVFIVKMSQTQLIHRDELRVIECSLFQVLYAVSERVDTLKGKYTL